MIGFINHMTHEALLNLNLRRQSMSFWFLVAAILCFLLAAFGVNPFDKVQIMPIGWACLAAAHLSGCALPWRT